MLGFSGHAAGGWAADSRDLVSEKYDIALFIEEHSGAPLYQEKLKGRYCAVRRSCADGSCFYRGLGFGFLESLVGKPQELLRFRERVKRSRHQLLAAGVPEHGFSRPYDTFLSLVDVAESDVSECNLLRAFNHPEVSDRAVQYLRLVTSAFLRSRGDFYQPFIEEEKGIEEYCAQNVEPMSAVCDHIQITAVTQELDIPLLVEYVDSTDSAVNQHIFPEGSSPHVYMLYKQNHYTLLYK
ncbi:ubiquitin thioesterase OTUB2 isoform X2 [Bufo bufo]|uniref:ubiquitin thioesterase OTUB2 isoform X2 n=1 Tax=Bufo bufo TaxID=8384 RepID=UPI001ABEE726|nr:ubiquitin thioesterase OTUB2 isoform X2 [Bufo bufo]